MLFRKQLVTVAGRIAGLLLFLMISMQVLAVGAQGLSAGLASAFSISEGMQDFLQSFFPCILAELLTFWLAWILFAPRARSLGFCRPLPGSGTLCLHGIFGALGASVMAYLVVTVGILFLELIGHPLVMPDIQMPRDSVPAALLYVLYLCVVGPFLEEVLFRGVVLHALLPYGKATAILVSAVLFGLFHGNPVQFPVGFFVGLLLGFLVVETKSIWPAVGAHIFNNSFVSLPELFSTNQLLLQSIWQALYFLVGFAMLAFLNVRYRKRWSALVKEESVSLLTKGQKIMRILLHPLTIFYLLLYVGICVLFLMQYVA